MTRIFHLIVEWYKCGNPDVSLQCNFRTFCYSCHPRTHLCVYLKLHNLHTATIGSMNGEHSGLNKTSKGCPWIRHVTMFRQKKAQVKHNLKKTTRRLKREFQNLFLCVRLCCFMRYLQQQIVIFFAKNNCSVHILPEKYIYIVALQLRSLYLAWENGTLKAIWQYLKFKNQWHGESFK